VRSLQLQAALAEFLAQAALSLQADVLAGQEVPFELASHSSRRRGASPLYCYRPLTGPYVAERYPRLRSLPGYGPVVALLQGHPGLERYLISTGAERPARGSRERCDAALLALLQDVFDEHTDFDERSRHERDERLRRALERLESSAFAGASEVTLVATLHGLTIASSELQLTRGLSIAQPHALQGAPEEALRAGLRDEDDHLLVVFRGEDPDPRAAIARGGEVLRELLRALRLFGDARISLGPLAFSRVGSAPWSSMALGAGGRPYGMLLVTADQEDELRAFCNLLSRRSPGDGPVAWALRRFELGCERSSEYDGLTDNLLALRALLGAPAPAGPEPGTPDGLFAARLAALCATPEQRACVAERTLRAIALERHAIAGSAVPRAGSLALARELSDHLRSLLRDVICGHLSADLALLADELLLSGAVVGEEGEGAQDGGAGAQGGGVGEPGGGAGAQGGGAGTADGGEGADSALIGAAAARRVRSGSREQPLGDPRESSEIVHVAV
jgi:hypothetical protein